MIISQKYVFQSDSVAEDINQTSRWGGALGSFVASVPNVFANNVRYLNTPMLDWLLDK